MKSPGGWLEILASSLVRTWTGGDWSGSSEFSLCRAIFAEPNHDFTGDFQPDCPHVQRRVRTHVHGKNASAFAIWTFGNLVSMGMTFLNHEHVVNNLFDDWTWVADAKVSSRIG